MKTQELLDTIRRDWARERPDIDTTAQLTVIGIQRLSALLEQELERFFAPFDLTPSSFDVLATLRRSAPPEGLAFTRLSTLMAITPPAVTKRVDLLAARGLVERRAHPDDRRTVLVRLTPTGRELVDHVLTLHVANERRLLLGLTPFEAAQLRGLVGKFAAHLEQTP
ncbi:MarR family transcriptional regulator [Deinococcus irradiatisoli]|uniref:MarR family transcriptional regulator n=1 Tax=Deinococcus irradiatisoli TaxID=2202254 RepID=A0A2Z3JQI8_9DEIO|nr:MarR family transcriptional regulator [Deinococcus irradiatisoli]AWN23688.1 MarR family transcriptional regulator [Deinococcus irradiatisoli]